MSDGELEFETVYDTYQPQILRYAARLVGEDGAEDLTQEVFVKVGRALKTFRGESQLSTWIYRIATNAALDRLRRPSVRLKTETRRLNDDGEQDAGEVEDRNVWTGEKPLSVEHQVVRKEMNDCIADVVNRLPESLRTVIVLSELEGLPNAEIATILGITLPAVKIRLHRARAALKKELANTCDFYHDERNEFACERKCPCEPQ